MGMTEKFDSLILSLSNNPNFCSTQPRDDPGPQRDQLPAQPQGQGRRHDAVPVQPQQLDYRSPVYGDYVDQQLRREEFSVPKHPDGKALASDLYTVDMIPKPYMYMDRQGAYTLKKKLDLRDTMSFHEYVVSYIKMLRDPRSGQFAMVEEHLEHLQHVVEDAAVMDWPSVRRWSHATFDDVEKGEYAWSDRQIIRLERMQHAIMAARSRPPHQQIQERRDIPCRDYNSPSGCPNTSSHQGRNVVFVHTCSQCFSAGERSQHPAYTCPRRYPAHAMPMSRTPVNPPAIYTASKNGMQASLQTRPGRPTQLEAPLQ